MKNSTDSLDLENEIDLWAVVKWMWARKLSYFLIVIIGAVLFAGYSYIVPKQYTASVILLPKIPVQRAGLLGSLASFTGESMTLEGVDEELYGRVIHSNWILDRAIERRWPGLSLEDSLSLFDVYGLNGLLEEKGRGYAGHVLKNILRSGVIRFDRDPMNGVMKISATISENPQLAASLANYLADELESYNRNINNKNAVKLRDFVETRLGEVQGKLENAEADITQFLQKNERYRSSPKLLQKHGELEREVHAYRTIWLQLRSQLENANIDVNKEIDSINILDRAISPFHRSAPKRWIYLFLGAFVGFLIATALGISKQLYQR